MRSLGELAVYFSPIGPSSRVSPSIWGAISVDLGRFFSISRPARHEYKPGRDARVHFRCRGCSTRLPLGKRAPSKRARAKRREYIKEEARGAKWRGSTSKRKACERGGERASFAQPPHDAPAALCCSGTALWLSGPGQSSIGARLGRDRL